MFVSTSKHKFHQGQQNHEPFKSEIYSRIDNQKKTYIFLRDKVYTVLKKSTKNHFFIPEYASFRKKSYKCVGFLVKIISRFHKYLLSSWIFLLWIY